MKRKSYRFKSLGISLVFIWISATVADAAYVRSSSSFLKESPTIKADNLLKLEKGEEVSVLEEKGFWRRIEVRGQTGWISRMSLNEVQQLEKVTNQTLIKKQRTTKRGIRTRVARAAVGVKGLRASRIEQLEDNYDMDALKVMESYRVEETRAVIFLQVDEGD